MNVMMAHWKIQRMIKLNLSISSVTFISLCITSSDWILFFLSKDQFPLNIISWLFLSLWCWDSWETRLTQCFPQAEWEPWPSVDECRSGIGASSLACRKSTGLNLKLTYLPTGEEGGCSSLKDNKSLRIICFSTSWTPLEISVPPSGPWIP